MAQLYYSFYQIVIYSWVCQKQVCACQYGKIDVSQTSGCRATPLRKPSVSGESRVAFTMQWQRARAIDTTKNVDFFAAYVIPQNAWYILPWSVVLKTKSHDLMLCPVRQLRRDLYLYL